jgi:Rrf2 family transcriptional regulator, iron-sulfur cluster assembly transcription factor
MRLELTKKTDLAFRALEYIAISGGNRVTGTILAEELDITTQYLPHVMAPLTRAGWVESTSGPRGGYTITTVLTDASLLDLVEAVEGGFDDSRCLHLGPQHDTNRHCALHEPWRRARTALLSELSNSKLADMIAIPQ